MSWNEFGLKSYPEYFHTKWWQGLKQKYIYDDVLSCCFICQRRSTLLLHHVSYSSLYKEKLYDDVYILCHDCHDLTHFWFHRLIKVPLYINALLFSMRMRRSIFCLHNRQYLHFLFWLIVPMIIGMFYLVNWIIVGLVSKMWHLRP